MAHLVGQEQADGLQALLPPVHIVPQEQVVGFWREAPVLKEPQQVRVLPVDVTCALRSAQLCASRTHSSSLAESARTADLDGGLQLQQVWLGDEDLSRLGA